MANALAIARPTDARLASACGRHGERTFAPDSGQTNFRSGLGRNHHSGVIVAFAPVVRRSEDRPYVAGSAKPDAFSARTGARTSAYRWRRRNNIVGEQSAGTR
jgi:hypothetical protein